MQAILLVYKNASVYKGLTEMPEQVAKMILTTRVSKELHRWIKAEAKRNDRSMNEEVVVLLQQAREGKEAKPLLDELRSLLVETRKK
jgi:hypothetical protein